MSQINITGHQGTANQKLSEDWKDKEAYLKAELDNTIATCNDNDREDIQKAYTIRNGKRPRSKFKYLQEAYGIHYPAKIRHIPVLKSMFDAIIAIDQSSPLDFKVTSKDVDTLKTNQEELSQKLVEKFVNLAKEQIEQASEYYESTKRGENPAPPDKMDDIKLKRLVQKIHTNFKASIEIDAQDFLETMIQRLELEILKSIMAEDLMCSGSEYYQVKAIEKGKKPLVRVINPKSIYYRKDPNKKFLREHSRVLIKEKITIQDLLMNFGYKMKEADIKRLLENYDINVDTGNKFWNMRYMGSIRRKDGEKNESSYDELYDTEVTLYYAEWMANTEIEYDDPYLDDMEVKYEKKRRYRKDRYEGYRVNDDIYFGLEKSKFIYRPTDDPDNCYLTINGASYNDRNGEPYSLVLNTEDIADKIDVLHYLWESMIAMSGGKAAMVNYRQIPAWLSEDPKDRVVKWIGMIKQGAAILDPGQKGSNNDFHNSGQIDLSIDASIGVILEMIRYLEEVAGKITGVSRQMIGSITPQDLKGTTQAAINQSSLVLMPFFFTHNAVIRQMLTDVINVGRLVYENGFMASYILGDHQQKIFSIDNDKFWLADFDVWLSNSGEEHKAIEELKALSIELVKANQIDAMDAVNMNTIKSLTKIKDALQKSIAAKEDSQVDVLTEQLQQVQEEMEKMAAELEKIDQAKMKMQEREQALKEKELEVETFLKNKELDIKEEYDAKKIDLEKKRVALEAMQLSYDSKSAEIRNS